MVATWHRLAVVVVVVLVAAIAMVAITYSFPAIHAVAQRLGGSSRMGVWLAALIAPAYYLFQRFGGWLTNLFGSGPSADKIAEQNQAIKDQLAQIRRDVDAIDARRTRELDDQRAHLAILEQQLGTMKAERATIQSRIEALAAANPAAVGAAMSDEELLRHFPNPVTEQPGGELIP